MKKKKNRPQKRTLEAILTVVREVEKIGDCTISYSKIKKVLKISIFSTLHVENWNKIIPLMNLEIIQSPGPGGIEKLIKFLNLTEVKAELKKLLMLHHNINIDDREEAKKVAANLKQLPKSKSVKVSNKKLLIKEEDFVNIGDRNNVIYIIGGLLYTRHFHKFAQRAIPMSELQISLNKEFGLNISKTELMNLIRSIPQLELISTISNGTVKFSGDPEVAWEIIKEKFSPKNDQREVIARLSYSPKEIENVTVLSCELLSEISPTEGIYKINYNKSRKDLFELVRLVRTFRGKDEIFDKDLVNEIRREDIKLEARMTKGLPEYEIENL